MCGGQGDKLLTEGAEGGGEEEAGDGVSGFYTATSNLACSFSQLVCRCRQHPQRLLTLPPPPPVLLLLPLFHVPYYGYYYFPFSSTFFAKFFGATRRFGFHVIIAAHELQLIRDDSCKSFAPR